MRETTLSHITSEVERQRRYTDLRAVMADAGYEALVICSRGDEFVRGRVQYISDIFQWAGRGFVVLPLAADATYVGDPLWGTSRAEAAGWITDLRLSEDPGYEVSTVLSDLRLAPTARVGLVGVSDGGAWSHIERLTTLASGVVFNDATDLFDSVRAIKSAEEVANLRETSAILRRVFDALAAEIRPGIPERDVLAEAHRLCRQFGCVDGIALMGRPPFRYFGAGSDVPIQADDIIVIDLEWGGPSGYWLELRRCYSFGKPPSDVMRFWEIRRETFDACVDVMCAGAHAIEILAARDAVHRKHGYPAVNGMRYAAHGIGLDSLEPPWVPGNDRVLAPGMVLSLHPDITVPDPSESARVGGISVADNILVTGDRPERLTDESVDWVVLS